MFSFYLFFWLPFTDPRGPFFLVTNRRSFGDGFLGGHGCGKTKRIRVLPAGLFGGSQQRPTFGLAFCWAIDPRRALPNICATRPQAFNSREKG